MKIVLDKKEYEALVNEKLFQTYGTALGLGTVEKMNVTMGSSYSSDYCTIKKVVEEKEVGDD